MAGVYWQQSPALARSQQCPESDSIKASEQHPRRMEVAGIPDYKRLSKPSNRSNRSRQVIFMTSIHCPQRLVSGHSCGPSQINSTHPFDRCNQITEIITQFIRTFDARCFQGLPICEMEALHVTLLVDTRRSSCVLFVYLIWKPLPCYLLALSERFAGRGWPTELKINLVGSLCLPAVDRLRKFSGLNHGAYSLGFYGIRSYTVYTIVNTAYIASPNAFMQHSATISLANRWRITAVLVVASTRTARTWDASHLCSVRQFVSYKLYDENQPANYISLPVQAMKCQAM